MPPRGTPAPNPATVDRVPPHSEESERAVLGSILLDAPRVMDICIERHLAPEAFYGKGHATVFETLLDMHRRQAVIDLNTVTARLRDIKRLDEIGGHPRLVEFVESTVTPAHAEHYAEIVHQKHLLRSLIDRSREIIEDCYLGREDAGAIVSRAEERILAIDEMRGGNIAPWPDLIREVVKDIDAIIERKGGRTGVSTGYRDLDSVLLGFQPGDMIILAARPSMGKTSLAMNIVEHIATGANSDTGYGDLEPRPVLVFSCEMSRESLVRRMIFSRARLEWAKVPKGFLSRQEHGRMITAADALMKAQIFVDDTAGLQVAELRSRARRVYRSQPKLALIVVDYLQMLNDRESNREGRQRETAAISGALKAMAKELRVPVLVLSQLSRNPEMRSDKDQTPRLSDLRDSGSIEQDADVVMLLQRPCRIRGHKDEKDTRLAIVDIAKHRNGATRQIRMDFEDFCMRFEDHNPRGDADTVAALPSEGGIE
mgnify:FL=1